MEDKDRIGKYLQYVIDGVVLLLIISTGWDITFDAHPIHRAWVVLKNEVIGWGLALVVLGGFGAACVTIILRVDNKRWPKPREVIDFFRHPE